MTRSLNSILAALLLLLAAGCGGGGTVFGNGADSGPVALVHIVTLANINQNSTNSTVLDHPKLNGNENAVLLITQNKSPEGANGDFNPHPVGVWYDGSFWNIFNEDDANMPVGCAFNVRIVTGEPNAFVWTAVTNENITANRTSISHPSTDNQPTAVVFSTQTWNPGGGLIGVYNPQPIGVFYNQQWAVFNQDKQVAMPPGSAYNVASYPADENAYVHIATPQNSPANITRLSHPKLDANPNARFQVMQTWHPNSIYNDHPIGVWYDGAGWNVLHEDGTAITLGAAFNISID